MGIGIPRPSRSKYGISLTAFAAMTEESLSALKRQSVKDPEALKARIDALLGEPDPTPAQPNVDELELAIWKARTNTGHSIRKRSRRFLGRSH
jgi:hypothetical protein